MAHVSDCATNNAPALPVGPCDCGDLPTPAEELQMLREHVAELEDELYRAKDSLRRLESEQTTG